MGLVGPTALSLSSAIQSTPDLAKVDILSVSLDSKATDLLRRIADDRGIAIQFHPLKDDAFGSARHKGRHVPKAALARLFLPHLMEGRVLYIDGDTYVRRDLAEVYGISMDGHLIGGVRDSGSLHALHRISRGKTWSHLEETAKIVAPSPVHSYINSGVLLMDCGAIRNEGSLAEGMLKFERAIGYRTVDQDFINELFRGRIKHLNPAWNSSWGRASLQRSWAKDHGCSGAELKEEKDGIYHFHGPLKPWHSLPRDKWKRSIYAVAIYKAALWSFRRRYPEAIFT